MIHKIINAFPLINIISEERLAKIINEALKIKLFVPSSDFILSEVSKIYTKPQTIDYSDGSDFCNWLDWRSAVNKWSRNHYLPVWKQTNGAVRSISQACELCADVWMNKIFNVSLQDNGAWDEGESGLMMNAFGSMLKTKAMQDIPQEIKDKVKSGIIQYYQDFTHRYGLSCDYDPCTNLYHILRNAGISRSDIKQICPWKTSLRIVADDNSVLVHTYQNDEYI